MALSMEEQRLLAEIERGLADEDPVLAARLSAFKHPGLALTLRLRRGRLLASVASVIAVAAVSVVAYLFVPFAHRAAPDRGQVPGAPAISDTGTRVTPGTAPRHGSTPRKAGVRSASPGTSIRAPRSAAPGNGKASASGIAGSRQNRGAASGSKAPALSRSAGSTAGASASSTPGARK